MWILKKTYKIILILMAFVIGFGININTSPSQGDFIASQNIVHENNISVKIFDIENIVPNAYANTDTNTQQTDPESKNIAEMFNTVIRFLNGALGIVTVLVSPLIMFAGWLMSPDWVTGDIFGLREKMYSLWITVSNIVYFVYAILLIIIAIATIFNSQNYGYKALLPKLFIGIILVPISWWFVQFVVSTATMVTATVLEIPGSISEKLNKEDWMNKPSIPKTIEISTEKLGLDKLKEQCKDEANCKKPIDVIKDASGIYSPLLVYGYGIFKIQNVKDIETSSGTDVVKNIATLINGMFFSLIMMLVFGVLVIALTFILFVRAIKMWMYAIFSPLFSFKIVFEKQWTWDTADTFSIKEFIGLAFVPAVIGLALSFGLIVANTISSGLWAAAPTECNLSTDAWKNDGLWCALMTNIMGNPANGIYQKVTKIGSSTEGAALSKSGVTSEDSVSITTVKIGGINLEFKGNLWKWAPVEVSKWETFLSGFGTIIVQFIALIFIWIAFMAAGKINKWVGAVLKPFEDLWNRVKTMSQESIKHVPLPIVGNVHGLGKTMEYMESARATKLNNDFAASAAGKKFDAPYTSVKVEQSVKQTLQIIGNWDGTNAAKAAHGTVTTIMNDKWFADDIKKQRDRIGDFFANAWSAISDRTKEYQLAQRLWIDRENLLFIKQNGLAAFGNRLKSSWGMNEDQARAVLTQIQNSHGAWTVHDRQTITPQGWSNSSGSSSSNNNWTPPNNQPTQNQPTSQSNNPPNP